MEQSIMAYLFPGTMFRRLKAALKQHSLGIEIEIDQSLNDAYTLYEFTTKQYLGLGSLVQFIPNTNQNRARKQLLEILEPQIEKTKDVLKKCNTGAFDRNNKFHLSTFFITGATLSSYLNFSHLFYLSNAIVNGFTTNKTYLLSHRIKTLTVSIPFIGNMLNLDKDAKNIFVTNKYTRLLDSVLNPAIPILASLNFLHTLAHLSVDACNSSLNSTRFSFIPYIMRRLVNLTFGLAKIPVLTAKKSIDLAWDALDVLVFNPLLHFAKSLKLTYDNWGKSFYLATAHELQNAKILRKVAKTNASIEKIDRPHLAKMYIGPKKEIVNSQSITQTTLIGLSGTPAQIAQIKGLVAICGTFKSMGNTEKGVSEDPTSINSAQRLMKLN